MQSSRLTLKFILDFAPGLGADLSPRKAVWSPFPIFDDELQGLGLLFISFSLE